jgi:hypothetical protein
MDSIMVKVVFLQPVVKSQRLCPFYQEDKCRFDDADCRFSHGEVVPLAKLREYRYYVKNIRIFSILHYWSVFF